MEHSIIKIRGRSRKKLNLDEAKKHIYNYSEIDNINLPGFIDSLHKTVVFQCGTQSRADSNIIKLQIICMIGHPTILKEFLSKFLSENGVVATELIVNSQMKAGINILHCNPFYITPLLCCLLWNNEPELVRILYSYGAKMDRVDLDYTFPEEKTMTIPYFDHISTNSFGQFPFPMWRDSNDFKDIFLELNRLTNEETSPVHWHFPEKYI
tara:strand:- start:1247 stop:1876 length:630 start_codon:yes stop_codon:yes gene_type:complete